MKDYKRFSIIILWFVIGLISLSIIMSQVYDRFYDRGYLDGGVAGYGMALDTVYKIVDNNIKHDTCTSKLTIVTNRDTVTYFLHKKLFKK